MGNWVGRDKGVYPIEQDHHDHDQLLGHTSTSSSSSSSNGLRIKVRMSRRQLKELMAQVDMTKGKGCDSSEQLGRAIVQECLEGRLTARVVAAENHDQLQVSNYEKGWMLSTISEDQQEHDHSL